MRHALIGLVRVKLSRIIQRHVAADQLASPILLKQADERILPVRKRMNEEDALALCRASRGRTLRGFNQLIDIAFAVLASEQAMRRNQAAKLAGHGRILRNLRAKAGISAHLAQRSVGTGDGFAQTGLVELSAGQLLQLCRQHTELIGDIGNGVVIRVGRHVDRNLRHAVEFRQTAEGQLIRVAGDCRVGDKQGFGQNARLRHADHRLLIRAEALRNARFLRMLTEHMLTGSAGDINRQPLRKHGLQAHRVHQLAGHEDIDHHGVLRLLHGADDGFCNRSVHARIGGFGVRQARACAGKSDP